MQITNKKLAKEIKSILVSSDKAKKLALQEIEKIDAKYKALAEKEKASLTETVKLIDAQILLYTPMLAGEDVQEEVNEPETEAEEVKEGPVVEQPVQKEEPQTEASIVDTLFLENNVEETLVEDMPAEEPVEEAWSEDPFQAVEEPSTEIKITDGIKESDDWSILKEWE